MEAPKENLNIENPGQLAPPALTPDELKKQYELEKAKWDSLNAKRQYEANIEARKLALEEMKAMEEKRKNPRLFRLSIFTSMISILGIVASSLISLQVLNTNADLSKTNLEIQLEQANEKKLERLDALKSEYYSDQTSRARKESIALELLSEKYSTILPQHDKDRFTEYIASFKLAVEEKQKIVETSEKKIAQHEQSITPEQETVLNEAEAKQIQLENSLNTAASSSEKQSIANKLLALTANLKVANPTVSLLDSLSSAQKDLTQFRQTSAVEKPIVSWLKVGYYRKFDSFTIALSELHGSSGKIAIETPIGKDKDYATNYIDFAIGDKKSFTVGGNQFEIDFVKIDRAGKNPLTKALYFSIKQNTSTRYFDNSFDKSFE